MENLYIFVLYTPHGPTTESWLFGDSAAATFSKIREQSARHGGTRFVLKIFKGYLLIEMVDGLLHEIKLIRCILRMAEARLLGTPNVKTGRKRKNPKL